MLLCIVVTVVVTIIVIIIAFICIRCIKRMGRAKKFRLSPRSQETSPALNSYTFNENSDEELFETEPKRFLGPALDAAVDVEAEAAQNIAPRPLPRRSGRVSLIPDRLNYAHF